jgi:hypothetical protein
VRSRVPDRRDGRGTPRATLDLEVVTMRFELFRCVRFFGCALALVAGAAASGCGSTYEPAQPHTASYVKTAAAKKAPVSPLNHAMRPNAPKDPHASHGPISLTGEMPYAERFDPSGWSGSSTPPEGMGGGPPAAESPENPYEEAPASGLAPTDALPTPGKAKDLDTAPTPPPSDDQPPPQ